MATARVFRNDRACPPFGVDRELELAASLRPRHYAGRIAPHIGARIFSLTPSMADPDRRNGSRADEVLAYLAGPAERPGSVVIDDERSYADTAAAGWLILADGDEGFGERAATQLDATHGRRA
jgi:glutathione S-transferase